MLTILFAKVMELGGLLVQITHVQVFLPTPLNVLVSSDNIAHHDYFTFYPMQRELAKAELDKQRRELNER